MLVGSHDVLLPTTMVGNYPNPRWYDGHAFAQFAKGEFIHDSISREAFEDAVLAIVHDQEEAGLDVIADGKVYGGDSPYAQIIYHYYERMTGFRPSGGSVGLPVFSTLSSPAVVGEVTRMHPFHLATLRATRKATSKPVKISYVGIQVLAAAATNTYYGSTRELGMAIARAFHEDFAELEQNGCDIIQLDESVWPFGMGDWEVDAVNSAMDGIDCQFWVHTCWGNYSGTPGHAPARAAALFPKVNGTHITALNYEVGRTGPGDLKPLVEHGWDRPFVAGVIDVKTTITETPDEVADRIREVLAYVPAERLALTTDCGLINLPRTIAIGKLRALAEGAAIVRAELAGSQPVRGAGPPVPSTRAAAGGRA
jgi:2-hydroxypropyl-CoM lyase